MGDHQDGAFRLLLQPREKPQYPLFVLKEGLTPLRLDSKRIPRYRPLILLYRPAVETGADIVERKIGSGLDSKLPLLSTTKIVPKLALSAQSYPRW